MEDGLVHTKVKVVSYKVARVLILVVMEDGLVLTIEPNIVVSIQYMS